MGQSSKQLSNPYSTGGGGPHFEAHIQAMFVILMLVRGPAPTMPAWPIREIRFQNKIHGYHTDDLLVVVEDQHTKTTAKLVAQIRHTVRITKSDSQFRNLVQAAWQDFNNKMHFDTQVDNIALITGPLSATDTYDVPWLLNQARHTPDPQEFFLKVSQANFSSDAKRKKLDTIQTILNVSDGDLHSFLRRFHLLMYDLGSDASSILSLLNALIMQFENVNPERVWGRVVDLVQSWNQDAGAIILEDLPQDLRDSFVTKAQMVMPTNLSASETMQVEHSAIKTPQSPILVAANLLGGWNDRTEADLMIVDRLMTRFRS